MTASKVDLTPKCVAPDTGPWTCCFHVQSLPCFSRSVFLFPPPTPQFSDFLLSNNVKLSCTGSSLLFSSPKSFPFKGKKKRSEVPVFFSVPIFLPIAIPCMTLDAPHMLSFQPFLKLSSWGEGREASWAFQPPSPPPSQTLLGTPQGQLLLSLGAPQDGGQVAMGPASERARCVCVCMCV